MVTLYHFTNEARWQEIAAAGEIISLAEQERRDPWLLEWDLPHELAVDPSELDADQLAFMQFAEHHDEFVWLTTHPLPPLGRAWPIRIQVEVDDARRWRAYAREHEIPHGISEMLGDTGPGRYYVVDRAIPRAEWVVVERLPADVVDICAAMTPEKAALRLAGRTLEAEALWQAPAGAAA